MSSAQAEADRCHVRKAPCSAIPQGPEHRMHISQAARMQRETGARPEPWLVVATELSTVQTCGQWLLAGPKLDRNNMRRCLEYT